MELELDHAALDQGLERFHQHVRRAYLACADAVGEELARQLSGPSDQGLTTDDREPSPNGAPETAKVHVEQSGDVPQATRRQLSFVRQLATQIRGLGVRRLETLVMSRFDSCSPRFPLPEAADLIRLMKELRAGKLDLEKLLGGNCCREPGGIAIASPAQGADRLPVRWTAGYPRVAEPLLARSASAHYPLILLRPAGSAGRLCVP